MARKIALAVLATLTIVLVIGAIASATSRDKVQDVVETLIVNDTGVPVGLGLCHDQACSVTDKVLSLKPGDTYNQAVGPNETQRFAVVAGSESTVRSSAVAGKSYRCTKLVSGAHVDARYPISSLFAC